MSSSCGSVCLLVLLGAVMALGSPFNFHPDNLIPVDKSIQHLLKLTDVGANPLFSSVIKSINTSCQRKEDIMLMNTTLGIYMQMFSSILHHSHNPHQDQHHGRTTTLALLDQLSGADRTQVKEVVKMLQQKIADLRRSLGQINNDNQDVLSKLNKIKVDDPVDQRKALAEFTLVYKAASNLVQ